MGIPGLDPKVQKDYPEGVRKFRDGEQVPGQIVDVHASDANPFVHNAHRKVFEMLAEHGEFDSTLRGLSKAEIEELIFEEMWDNMLIDLERVKPVGGFGENEGSGGWLIAFDGSAPKAKQVQQRERRFGSGMEIAQKVFGTEDPPIIRDIILEELSGGTYVSPLDLPGEWKDAWKDFVEEEGVSHFNSNKITPGTPFSRRLSEWIKKRLEREVTKYDNKPLCMELYESTPATLNFKTLYIGFSDSSLPGEGEHKIMEFIQRGCDFQKEFDEGNLTYLHVPPSARERETPPTVSSFCISGPDGDLLMLMFCAIPYIMRNAKKGNSNKPIRVYLYKRDHFTPGLWRTYDAIKILKMIYDELIATPQIAITQGSSVTKIIPDFIYIGFSVGNDFVPKLKMFYTLNDGLNTILSILQEDIYTVRSEMLCERIKIGGKSTYIPKLSATQILFQTLATLEEEQLANQYPVNARLRDDESILTDHTLLSCFDEDGESFDYDMYRDKYYLKIIDGMIEQTYNPGDIEMLIDDMCRKYLRSLGWVLQYYLTGIPSWNWHYGYSHAPLISDLSRYLNKISSLGDIVWTDLHTFTLGTPSTPLKAALSVIPHVSAYLLVDSDSPGEVIADYYSQPPLVDNPIFIKFDYEGVGREYKKIAYVNHVEL